MECEPPNNRLNRFVGTLTVDNNLLALDNDSLLLRVSHCCLLDFNPNCCCFVTLEILQIIHICNNPNYNVITYWVVIIMVQVHCIGFVICHQE